MKVSVITACWNAEKRIERCITSLLQQSMPPSELIFVDGGSTDSTCQRINALLPSLHNKNIHTTILPQIRIPGEAGIPSAWNQGIKQASGDIIAILNSDDMYSTDALEYVTSIFLNNPNADIVAGPVVINDADGKKISILHPKCLWLANFLMPIAHPACFVRKTLYSHIGLYNTAYRISADYDFIWRCRRAHARFVFFNKTVTFMEAGGLANSSRPLARRETRDIALKYSRLPILPWTAWAVRSILRR